MSADQSRDVRSPTKSGLGPNDREVGAWVLGVTVRESVSLLTGVTWGTGPGAINLFNTKTKTHRMLSKYNCSHD